MSMPSVSSQQRPLPLRNFTRREYDKLVDAGVIGEDEHVELIDGSIVEMSPEGARHAGTIEVAADVLRRVFGAEHTVRVQHPLIVDPDGEPQPDIAVVHGGPRAHLAEHPHEAALVVEVAETSIAYDRGHKARLYARAGFPDYWIINLADDLVEVYRDPAAEGYRSVAVVARGAAVSPLGTASCSIAVADLLP
jgi:Uma2 family endonuclease